MVSKKWPYPRPISFPAFVCLSRHSQGISRRSFNIAATRLVLSTGRMIRRPRSSGRRISICKECNTSGSLFTKRYIFNAVSCSRPLKRRSFSRLASRWATRQAHAKSTSLEFSTVTSTIGCIHLLPAPLPASASAPAPAPLSASALGHSPR